MRIRFALAVFKEREKASEDECWKAFREILLEARRTTREWGGSFLFVYLPDYLRFAGGLPPEMDERRVAILDFLREEGFDYLDFTDVLTALDDPLSAFPFRLRGHYNADGYRALANAIRERLQLVGIEESGVQLGKDSEKETLGVGDQLAQ